MSLLMKKFPMKEGCPEGTQCVVCENDAINCTRKGVVYQATCQKYIVQLNLPKDRAPKYICETSRLVRTRTQEHKNASSIVEVKRLSFQIRVFGLLYQHLSITITLSYDIFYAQKPQLLTTSRPRNVKNTIFDIIF